MVNGCKCGHTRAEHKISRWDPQWGDHHKWANESATTELRPMLAAQSEPFFDEGWIYERKYDGLRALFKFDGSHIEISSRSGQDLTLVFPEFQDLDFPYPVTLDGEIYCPDGYGGESLQSLQMRMGQKNPEKVSNLTVSYPVRVAFFDILVWDGIDITDHLIGNRKSKLELTLGWMQNDLAHYGEELIPHSEEDYLKLRDMGYEGLIAKKKDSIYYPGKRRSVWKKFKFEKTLDLEVYGYTEVKGDASPYHRRFGALKVRDRDGVHRGQVGSGFTEVTHNICWDLWQLNQGVPKLIIEVEYRMLGKNGLLIEPRFNAIRYDKAEADKIEG